MLERTRNIIAFASGSAPDDGSADARSQEHGSLQVAIAVGGDHGRIAPVDRGAEHAAARHVAGHVETRIVLFGTPLAIPKPMTHDQPRIFRVQCLPIKTELLQGFGARIGDEDIGLRQELIHHFRARFALQIERDESLVQIDHVECKVLFI